jgi:peroxiredoxin
VQRLGLLGRAFYRLGRVDDAQRVAAETERLLLVARGRRAAAVDKAEDDAFAKKVPDDKRKEAMTEAGRTPTDSVQSVLDLQRELRGEELLAKGDGKGALAEFEAVKDFPKTLLADAMVKAGQPEKAIELLEQEVKEHSNRFPTMLRLLLAYEAAGKATHDARRKELLDLLLGERFAPDPSPIVVRSGWFKGEPGTSFRLAADDGGPVLPEPAFGADFGPRPPLASLGPKQWTPFANAGFSLPWVADPSTTIGLDRAGRSWELRSDPKLDGTRRPTLVVFYLGFSCLLCVEQLQALRKQHQAFADAGIDVVAIGDQDVATVRSSLAALPDDQRLPFALLADPQLAAFKAWRCFDDFERMPLHGTFLIDADGRVRWQDVSAVPFAQFDWLLHEARRLLALSAAAAAR